MNMAHEKRYQDWRTQYNPLFTPENRFSQQDEQIPLVDGFSLRSKAYLHQGEFLLNSSENELLDKEGKVRYSLSIIAVSVNFERL